MTNITPLNADRANAANYNAVKIQVNDPRTNIPEGFKSEDGDNGIYNAVNIEVNRPRVNAGMKKPEIKPIYNYPQANGIVTYDMAGIAPVLPVAYQTNLINNRTLINAEFEFEGIEPKQELEESEKVKEAEIVEEPKITEEEPVAVEEESKVEVPAPNYTTTEAEKGISFQAKPIEIVPSEEIKPDVDIQKVVSNLSDKDYDVQAKQMEEIAKISLEDSKNVIPYVTKEVFMSLIDILQKDTSELTPPTQEQINNRKKIILNEIVKEQAEANKEDVSKIELPYTLTKEEESSAKSLSEMELAERNKEYALYTMAVLSKVYTDEIFEHSGNIVPMTDLPGISTVVDTLRYNQNFEIKIAAIDALRYIERPEYKDELISLFTLAAGDESPYVARSAVIALSNMEDKK